MSDEPQPISGGAVDLPLPAPPPEQTNVWVSRSTIGTGFVGVFFGLALAWLSSILFAKEPKLSHVVLNSPTFKGEKDTVGIYQVVVSNVGNKEAEEVTFFMKIPGAEITKAVVYPESLRVVPAINGDNASVTIKTLNQNQQFQVSALASTTKYPSLPSIPEVTVAGKGVTSEMRVPEQPSLFNRQMAALVMMELIGGVGIAGIVLIVVGRGPFSARASDAVTRMAVAREALTDPTFMDALRLLDEVLKDGKKPPAS